MGCIVNGPGESKHADIGISLPGTGEAPAAPVFVDGTKVATLRGAGIAAEFKAMVDDYVARRYGLGGVSMPLRPQMRGRYGARAFARRPPRARAPGLSLHRSSLGDPDGA